MDNTASTADPSRRDLLGAMHVIDRGPSERFDRIVRTAREMFHVEYSYVNLLDEELLYVLTPTASDPAARMPTEASFCQFTVQSPTPLVIPDTTADPRYASLPGVTKRGIRFYAGVPLTMPGGIRIGSLCLMDTKPRELDDEDLAALVDLSQWAERLLAEALQHERLRTVVDATRPEPVALDGYTLSGFSIPRNGELGGDIYDWAYADDAVSFTLADVMGKGRAAGILAAGLRGALRARTGDAPDHAIASLEAQVAPDLARAESFATLFHGRLMPGSGRIDFVDAGHGIVLHLRADGSSDVIRSLDLPIGLHPSGIPRASGSIVLRSADALIVASDGVLDLGDGTLDALRMLGEVYRSAGDALVFEAKVRERAREFAEDDLSVVVVQRD